ncbi:MAG: PAS domain-containing protein [Leptospiraceae bacterium]|nr:PAS domain-containing protein [Leptospiraceae bacterium]
MEPLIQEYELEKSVDELIQKELQEETFLIHEFFKNSSVNILIFDKANQIIFVSNSFAKLVGYTPFELVGENLSKVLANPPSEEEKIDWERAENFTSSVRELVLSTGEKIPTLFYSNSIKEFGTIAFNSLVVNAIL